MIEKLTALRASVEQSMGEAKDLTALDELRVRLLGRKGELTQLLKTLGAMAPEERKQFGQVINEFRQQVESRLDEAKRAQEVRAQEQRLRMETLDVTMPGRVRTLGHSHPMTTVLNDMIALFIGMGFTVAEGPDVETEYHNFEALNIPANHPTRDEQDTFYLSEGFVLRTHTSPVQVRVMENEKPPIRIIAPGKVFRSDEVDATHTPVFHQLEGLVIDKGVTMSDLKGILELTARKLFGEQIQVRFRPSFFPFTEPSAEMDVTCHACGGTIPADGCRVCKDSGWIEVLGCGMVHPRVLAMSGIDPEIYTGYAFGMGVDRIASRLYGVTDPRLYFENDMQFLGQWPK